MGNPSLSARPWQENRGDGEQRESRSHTGREMVQAVQLSTKWDTSSSLESSLHQETSEQTEWGGESKGSVPRREETSLRDSASRWAGKWLSL